MPKRRMSNNSSASSSKENTYNVNLPVKEPFCQNPLCDHKNNSKKFKKLNMTAVKSVDDIIKLGMSFHCKKNLQFNGINLRLLCNIVTALNELNNMVGMQSIKEQIVDQILFFVQGFNNSTSCNKCIDCTYNLPCPYNKNEMLHTIICGPPGVGKTCFGKILGKIYKGLGVLKNGYFHEIKRSDLIAKYLGQTAYKTQDVINKASGGVLFIDEAYSLGNSSKEDIFSKECIDTLTYNLCENREFLCIIAGYTDDLEKCFFSVNPGLKRRFSFRYKMDKYNSSELLSIFENKIYLSNWKILYKNNNDDNMKEDIKNLFDVNYDSFPNQGGDMETLLLQCKIIHSRSLPKSDSKYILTNNDIIKGFELYLKNRDIKKEDPSWKNMFI